MLPRFMNLPPAHARIALGAAWIAAYLLAGKLAAAGRDAAIAWRYGVSDVVDAYQLAKTPGEHSRNDSTSASRWHVGRSCCKALPRASV
jgi:hypothetical protein